MAVTFALATLGGLDGGSAAPRVSESSVRHAGMDILTRRAAAVLAGDDRLWMADVDPAAMAFSGSTGALFQRLRLVPWERWTYQAEGKPRAQPLTGTENGSARWTLPILLRYRERGADTADVIRHRQVTVIHHTRTGERSYWVLADDRTVGLRDPWDVDNVRVISSDRAIVIGVGSGVSWRRLRSYAAMVTVAAQDVDNVWGVQWPRRLIVVVPTSVALFDEMSSDESGGRGSDARAAVTTGMPASGSRRLTVGDRIIINPAVFPFMPRVAQQLVLKHETVHVAVRSSTVNTAPAWLNEGFADYIGYRHSGISLAVGAADLAARLQSNPIIAIPPSSLDFRQKIDIVSVSYQLSWVLCWVIAHRHKEAALVRLVVAMGSSGASEERSAEMVFGRIASSVLGVSTRELTRQWQDALRQLALSAD
jgi:hypothetical protein